MKMEGEKRKKQRSRASNKHPLFKAIVPKHPIKFSRRFSNGHARKLCSRSAYGSQNSRYSATVSGDQYTLLYNNWNFYTETVISTVQMCPSNSFQVAVQSTSLAIFVSLFSRHMSGTFYLGTFVWLWFQFHSFFLSLLMSARGITMVTKRPPEKITNPQSFPPEQSPAVANFPHLSLHSLN